tara:strand:- start:37 stop:924 length:888 start_codon:yes stop_codon:yes gene_type:complete
MKTELTVATENGMSMAEMMGVSVGEGGKKSSSLARMTQIHSAIMGPMDVGGRTIKTEIIPSGSYKLDLGNGKIAYSINPQIRVFAVFQQWTRWDSENNQMQKTELERELKGDLKDTTGGFNLGRPSGYIEDWENLPQATKEIMRQVKRTKVLFGTVTLADAVDESGATLADVGTDVPFILDIKNRDSIKSLDAMIKKIYRLNVLPINYQIRLSAEEHTLPTGNTYNSMVLQLQEKQDIVASDSDVLDGFFDWIKWSNSYVLDQWSSKNKGDPAMSKIISETISDEDFVNVEGAAV